jgi:hypothetical protein
LAVDALTAAAKYFEAEGREAVRRSVGWVELGLFELVPVAAPAGEQI